MTGIELKTHRENRGLSQQEVADFLDVTDASVNRWEKGQAIPGPAQKLLELFFHGIHPFKGNSETGSSSISRLELTVDEFLELQRIANRHGFSDVKDYIVFAIRKHIAESKAHPPNVTPLRKPVDFKQIEDPPTTKVAESAK